MCVNAVQTRRFLCVCRKLGASEGTINQEIQRYQQLESVAVQDIRRDVRKKLRRSSMRVSSRSKPPLNYNRSSVVL